MKVTTYDTYEELGPHEDISIDLAIEWDITPAEPMIMYKPDGSGYPGSPAMAEVMTVNILTIEGPGWKQTRSLNMGLFLLLDELVGRPMVDADIERLTEAAFREAADKDDALREAAAEARVARIRGRDE